MTETYRPLEGSGPASFAAGEPGMPPPPWPPPGSTPPPPAAGGTPPPGREVAAPPPPVAPSASGPNEPGESDDDSFQPAPWIYLVIAALIVALLAFLFWRSRDDGDGDDTSATTVPEATIAPTVPPGTLPDGSQGPSGPTGATATPPVVTNPDGTPATTTSGTPVTNPDGTPVTNPDGTPVTVPGGTPVTNPDGTPVTVPGGAAVTNPDGSPVTNPDGTPVTAPPTATTVPGGSGPPTGSAAPPATSPGSAPAPTQTVPPLTSAALRTAQGMATALADGDWPEVRRLSPTDTRTVAELERDYAGLDSSTIVPARETTLSSGLVDLRLGLVAHESRATGPQTSLFCVHWIVDPTAGTVQRLDAARLRTVGGMIPAAQVAPELTVTCANIALR